MEVHPSFSSRFQAPDAIALLRRNTPPTRRVPALRSSFASSRLDAAGQPLRHLGISPARTPKFSNYFEFLDLYGSKLAARWSIQPRQGLRPSALWSRVSSDRVDLMGNVRVPAIRVSNISGGRFLFAGGLLGYIFSRNPTGMVSGGVILALSFFSLKVWRTGRSSLPFILDQAVISATLCLESSADFSLTSI